MPFSLKQVMTWFCTIFYYQLALFYTSLERLSRNKLPSKCVCYRDRSSVRISNPYLKPPADKTRNKDSKEGTDGSRSGKDGGATDSVLKPSDQQQQNPSSSSASDGNGNGAVGGDEGGNSISKREAHSPAPLSNQYFTVSSFSPHLLLCSTFSYVDNQVLNLNFILLRFNK